MNYDASIRTISNRLDHLEQIYPTTPQEAEEALHELQPVSAQLQDCLALIGDTLTLEKMMTIQLTHSRINRLNMRFMEQTPVIIATNKIREMARDING